MAPPRVVTGDPSLLLVYYRLEERLPLSIPEAEQLLTRLQQTGPVYVLLDRQQFIRDTFVMTPEEYAETPAGIIARTLRPVWRARQFQGLFMPFCFEHNRDIRQTLRWRQTPAAGEDIAIYEGEEARKALQQAIALASKRSRGTLSSR